MRDKLSLTFTALSDPTRRAILAKLSHGEATVQDLAKPFAISAPAITKHLKVLENAGLISRGRDAQFRPHAQRKTTPNGGHMDRRIQTPLGATIRSS